MNPAVSTTANVRKASNVAEDALVGVGRGATVGRRRPRQATATAATTATVQTNTRTRFPVRTLPHCSREILKPAHNDSAASTGMDTNDPRSPT